VQISTQQERIVIRLSSPSLTRPDAALTQHCVRHQRSPLSSESLRAGSASRSCGTVIRKPKPRCPAPVKHSSHGPFASPSPTANRRTESTAGHRSPGVYIAAAVGVVERRASRLMAKSSSRSWSTFESPARPSRHRRELRPCSATPARARPRSGPQESASWPAIYLCLAPPQRIQRVQGELLHGSTACSLPATQMLARALGRIGERGARNLHTSRDPPWANAIARITDCSRMLR